MSHVIWIVECSVQLQNGHQSTDIIRKISKKKRGIYCYKYQMWKTQTSQKIMLIVWIINAKAVIIGKYSWKEPFAFTPAVEIVGGECLNPG